MVQRNDLRVMLVIDENENSMIEKCDAKGISFKVRDLRSSGPYQYIFVLERILQLVPSPDEHIVEELELLFGFTKAEKEFSRGELFRLINSIYGTLAANYKDWQYPEIPE